MHATAGGRGDPTSTKPAHLRAAGFSLHELLVVAAILGFAGVVAIPSVSGSSPYRVEVAAAEVANAIRFARGEAVRTGEVREVQALWSTERIRVDKPIVSSGAVTGVESTLYDPASKKPYDFLVPELPFASGVTITSPAEPFTYTGLATKRGRLLFSPEGMPYWLESGIRYPLERGTVSVGDGRHRLDVDVSPLGRVTVQ